MMKLLRLLRIKTPVLAEFKLGAKVGFCYAGFTEQCSNILHSQCTVHVVCITKAFLHFTETKKKICALARLAARRLSQRYSDGPCIWETGDVKWLDNFMFTFVKFISVALLLDVYFPKTLSVCIASQS